MYLNVWIVKNLILSCILVLLILVAMVTNTSYSLMLSDKGSHSKAYEVVQVSSSRAPGFYINKSVETLFNVTLVDIKVINYTFREDTKDLFQLIGEAIDALRYEINNLSPVKGTCCYGNYVLGMPYGSLMDPIINAVDSIDTTWSRNNISIEYYTIENDTLHEAIGIAISDKFILIHTGGGRFLYISRDSPVVKDLALLDSSEIGEIAKKLVPVVKRYNSTLHVLVEYRVNNRYYRIPYIPDISLVYYGVSGEQTIISEETSFEINNNTLVPTKEYKLKLVNPYHVFYVYIDGIRVNYPLKLGLERTSNGFVVRFFEGYIPLTLAFFMTTREGFKVTNEYLANITWVFENSTGKKVDTRDLVIRDIYYAVDPTTKKFSPHLLVVNNKTGTTALIILHKNGPVVVKTNITYAGMGGIPSSPTPFTRDELIMLINTTIAYVRFKQYSSYAITGAFIVFTATVFTIWRRKRRKLVKKTSKTTK